MRLLFTDEFRSKTYYFTQAQESLLGNIYNVIDQGFSICQDELKGSKNGAQFHQVGRHFKFLCYSNSQLKNHSIWMLNEGNGLEVDKLRANMGDFSQETIVLKGLSRLGMVASTTKECCKLDQSEIDLGVELKDIERNGYNFTDGAGEISAEVAESINEEYALIDCSAYQFRLGGCKGVIQVNPKIEGRRVLLRNS